jgi:dipeptidyl aminopeptidase/acylaminoacyl peptidase
MPNIPIPNRDLIGVVSTASGQASKGVGQDDSIIVKTRDAETENIGFWKVWPMSRKTQLLLEEKRSCNYGAYSELLSDGSGVLFVWESADHPAELYEVDAHFKSVKRISNVGSSFDNRSLGHSRLVRWLDNDGKPLKGSLLLPSEYQPGRRYAMIVDVYPSEDGGSKALNRFGMGDYENWQLLATRKYAVFRPDIPTMPKTKMSDVAKSVLPGVQALIAMGVADPQRIGVIGHSDGGYAVLCLLVQSKIFRAAVMLSGSGDLIGSYTYDYGQRVIEESFGFQSTPWENRQIFFDNSPYFYLDRIEAPLLIVAGSEDTAVPPHLSEAVFKGLKRLGKSSVYIEYQREQHSPLYYAYEHQLDLFDRIRTWFDTYLGSSNPDPDRH